VCPTPFQWIEESETLVFTGTGKPKVPENWYYSRIPLVKFEEIFLNLIPSYSPLVSSKLN
jgi:hypothetical protein